MIFSMQVEAPFVLIAQGGLLECRRLCDNGQAYLTDLSDEEWMLIDEGYTVVGPAYRAEKALEMAYRHRPTLALIDIDLGGTIDGISVAAELAPLGVAVVFITADYKRAAVEGREFAADILIKPVTESTMLRSIAAILQHKQGTDTGRAALSA